jgi:hypothetical protein
MHKTAAVRLALAELGDALADPHHQSDVLLTATGDCEAGEARPGAAP